MDLTGEVYDLIFFWNRREVLVSTSMEKFNAVCNVLTANSIKYKDRVMNRNNANVMGSSRARTGTYGQNFNETYVYYVYVHPNDFEKAQSLL